MHARQKHCLPHIFLRANWKPPADQEIQSSDPAAMASLSKKTKPKSIAPHTNNNRLPEQTVTVHVDARPNAQQALCEYHYGW